LLTFKPENSEGSVGSPSVDDVVPFMIDVVLIGAVVMVARGDNKGTLAVYHRKSYVSQ